MFIEALYHVSVKGGGEIFQHFRASSGSGAFGWSTANPVTNYRTLDDSGVSNDVVKFLISSFEGRDIQDELGVGPLPMGVE